MTMRILPTLLLSVVASSVFAAPDPFDFHGADIVLLQSKQVQKELGITEAQRKQMNAFAAQHREHLAAYDRELQQKKIDPRTLPSPNPRILGFFEDLKKNVCGVLTPAQLRRLREISFQRVDLLALLDDQVAARLKLTSAQRSRLRSAYIAGSKEAAQIQQAAVQAALKRYQGVKPKDKADAERLQKQAQGDLRAAGARIAPQLRSIESQTRSKLLAVLTPAQRSQFEALKGRKFTP